MNANLLSYESIARINGWLEHHLLRGSKRVAIQSIHQQGAKELEATRLLVAFKPKTGVRTESLACVKCAIFVFVAVHCVKLTEYALRVITHE